MLHPDLRPVVGIHLHAIKKLMIKTDICHVSLIMHIEQFQQILKPSYNSVDMIEVELFDDDRSPRNFSKELAAVSNFATDQQWILI